MTGPGIGVAGPDRRGDLRSRVVGEVADSRWRCRTRLLVSDARRETASYPCLDRAVTEGQRVAAAEIILGIGRQHADAGGGAILADLGHLAGDQIVLVHVESGCALPG